ncbi:MAG: beta-N-acetylhexosaminidase [Clostridiales bacterium]|nr:beta-N-acetylhexosaminidase [Clostridiales bacterium]
MKSKLLTAITILLATTSCQNRPAVEACYDVIPLPYEVSYAPDSTMFRMDRNTCIVAGDSTQLTNAGLLSEYISTLTGLKPAIITDIPSNNYILLKADTGGNTDRYEITVTPDAVTIDGGSSAGTFYGVQTLRKAIPANEAIGHDVLFPTAHIVDQPRFSYRGALLDTGRHYFSPDSVKIFLDMMAMHNMNRFHWHITDDQGWRIEIKSLPQLTEVGSKRSKSIVGEVETGCYDDTPYEGFYTQEEIRDIVKYAADRHIEIIPEIDLPGHMQSVLASYPNLGCTGGPYEVWTDWGVTDEVVCAGNDSSYVFFDKVLSEVTELFPYEYVHIGGDECPKKRWEKCAKCQAKIKELGLRTDSHSTAEQKLQSHVMKHAADFLATKGRKAIGWDEILEGGCDTTTVIMSWRGVAGGMAAAKAGHDAIMSPTTYLYFDYKWSSDEGEPGAYYAPPLLFEKIYSYEPIPEDFTESQAAHIIGVQGNTWTERIPTFKIAQYMTLPRFAALSELQWTTAPKDYDAFQKRLKQLRGTYDAEGYNYNAKAFTYETH